MGILVRVLTLLFGLAVGFAGYFLMAAEGWPEPLEHMALERGVLGGLIVVLGLSLVWSAFKPKPRKRPAAQPEPEPAPIETPLALQDDPAPSAQAAPEPDPEPQHERELIVEPIETALVAAPAVVSPIAAANEAHIETHEPSAEGLDALLTKGDQLFAEGKADEALGPYGEALELARAEHAAHPDDAQAARDLARTLKSNADVYDEEGRLDSAIDLYEEALTLNRSLASSGSQTDQRALSLVLERLGDCREARGHRSRAVDLYRESLSIAEGLAEADPDNRLYADDLATTRKRLVELQGETAPA
jgi:tetratricopeptide (TPR) repeat protein